MNDETAFTPTHQLEVTFSHPNGSGRIAFSSLDAGGPLLPFIQNLIHGLTPLLTQVLTALIAAWLGGLTPAPTPPQAN